MEHHDIEQENTPHSYLTRGYGLSTVAKLENPDVDENAIFATQTLQLVCHHAALTWWTDPKTGADVRDNPLHFSNKLCLIHSEISESMEGDRKNKMDEHLPHRPSREVELADALIRICDLAGGYGLDLAGAVAEKLAYNARRADHKPENRVKEDGKVY